jgi:antitoxin ParD1/3/4
MPNTAQEIYNQVVSSLSLDERLRLATLILNDLEDIYQGRLQDLQQEAHIGWESAQRGELVDGSTAMAQIRANLHSRYAWKATKQEDKSYEERIY